MNAGVRQILLATVFFSASNVCVKALGHLPVFQIAFVRAAISTAITLGLLARAGVGPLGRNRIVLFWRGLFGTVTVVLFFITLHRLPLATAVTLQYLAPIFALMFSGRLLGEPTRLRQLAFVGIAFLGVVVSQIGRPSSTPETVAITDVWLSWGSVGIGVAAAAASAVALNLVRKLRSDDHLLVIVLYFPLVSVPITGPIALMQWVPPTAWDWALLGATGVLMQAAQMSMTSAYVSEKLSRVMPYTYFGLPIALVIGLILFDERLTMLGLIGLVLIVFGVLMATRQTAPRMRELS